MNRNWIGQLAGVAVALVVTACATNTAAVGHSPATAPGCPATLSVQAPPRSGQAQTGQPQPGPALVRQGASVATICQYATALPASKAAATPLRRLVMRGAAAAGLAAVLDNAGPLSGHAARCDRNAGRLPFSQLIRFGYPDGPGELAVITYTSCSLAVVTAGTRAGALTGPVQDDLFYYTTITRQDRGPRTPDLIGSTAATAQSSARRHGFGLGVDGEALDPAAAFGTIIFQVPPPSAVDSGPGSPSVGVIVAVPPTPACQPGHLRLDYRAGGPGAGNDFGTIIVRDVAGTPCRLAGQLRVTGVGPAGRPVTNTVTGSITGPGVLSPDAARSIDGAGSPPADLVYAWTLSAEYRDDPVAPNGLCTAYWVIPATWRVRLPGGSYLTVPNADRGSPGRALTPSGGLVTCRGRLGSTGPVEFFG